MKYELQQENERLRALAKAQGEEIAITRERDERLTYINAELVEALQHLVERHNSGGTNGAAMEWAQARAAIAKAKGEA